MVVNDTPRFVYTGELAEGFEGHTDDLPISPDHISDFGLGLVPSDEASARKYEGSPLTSELHFAYDVHGNARETCCVDVFAAVPSRGHNHSCLAVTAEGVLH